MSFGVKSGGCDVPVVMPPRVGVEEEGGSFAIANLLNFRGAGVRVTDGAQSGVKDITITSLGGADPVAAAVTTWHFDYINGDDANDGLTKATAFKTWAPYLARCGLVRYINFHIDFRFHSDHPHTDDVCGTIICGPLGNFSVIGDSLTVLHSGTLSSFRVPHPQSVPPNPAGITDAGVSSWAGLVGKLWRITSGPRAGTMNGKAWTAKDEGGGMLRILRPTYRDPADLLNIYEFTPAGTETYEICQPRKIGSLSLMADVGSRTPYTDNMCLENIRLPSILDGDPQYGYVPPYGTTLWWCQADILSIKQHDIHCNGSHLSYFWGLEDGSMTGYFNLDTSIGRNLGSPLAMGGTWMFQGAGPCVAGFNVSAGAIDFHSTSGGVEIYDSTATVFIIDRTKMTLRGDVSGLNNIGPFCTVNGGAEVVHSLLNYFTFQSDTNANGAYGAGAFDFKLSGSSTCPAVDDTTFLPILPARDLSWPNLIASTAAGGFGGSAINPKTGTRFVGS